MLFHRKAALAFVSIFALSALVPSSAISQDLKDELDAIDDTPEADLSGGSPKSSPSAPSGGDELPADDLGGDLGDLDSAPDSGSKADDLNLDDLDSGKSTTQEGDLPSDDLSTLDDKSSNGLGDDIGALDENKATNPQQATTGLDAEPAARVSSLIFRQLPDRVRVSIDADRAIDYVKQVRAPRKQIILEFHNAVITRSVLKRAIDTGEFDGPVALVQAFPSKDGVTPSVKVLMQLRYMADPKITRSGNNLIVDFPLTGDGRLFKSGSAARVPTIPETFLTLDSKAHFVGKRISMNVKDLDLASFLKTISRESGQNFVLTGGGSKVTLNVANTPWDQVLAIALAGQKMGYQKMGSVYRVAPAADLQAEIASAAKLVADAENLIPLETRIMSLNYAKATDVTANLRDFQTARGKLSVDARTNSLVVTDTPDVLEKVLTYIHSVDRQTALVQIEARVVEGTQDFSRNLSQKFALGDTANGSFISVNDLTDLGPLTGEVGKIGGSMKFRTNVGSLGAIDAFLGLTEVEGTSKTIASPRVIVLDNKTASISSGSTLQIPTGIGTLTPISRQLLLSVTPQITSDGFVQMHVDLTRDTPKQDPKDTSNRRISTDMLVESGKTAVMGGIYTIDNSENDVGYPFLRGIPIFGNLFRSAKDIQKSTVELLMFISPKIINSDRAFLSYKDDVKDSESHSKTAKAPSEDDLSGASGDSLDGLGEL